MTTWEEPGDEVDFAYASMQKRGTYAWDSTVHLSVCLSSLNCVTKTIYVFLIELLLGFLKQGMLSLVEFNRCVVLFS